MEPRAKGVLESSLYVDDLRAAAKFYGQFLGLEEVLREEGRHLFYRCGAGMLLLFLPDASCHPSHVRQQLIPPHGAHGPGHLAFRVDHDEIASWRQRLAEAQIPIESEVRWPNGARSLYFRDPAGNSIELATPDLWGIVD